MKSRITGKPASKKTMEESIKEFEIIDAKEELENLQNEEIIKSGQKKKVNSQTYFEHFDPGNCRFCMNYIFVTDRCKLNMPNIDPWYTKDHDLMDECEEWDYIYEEDDIDKSN